MFSFGLILQALILFLFTAAAVYFLIVLPLNALAARRKSGEEEEPAAPAEDILLLQEIRDLLANRLTPAIVNDAGHRPCDGPRGHGTPALPDRPRAPTFRRRSRLARPPRRSLSDRRHARPELRRSASKP